MGLPFFSKLDWSFYVVYIAKTFSKKIRSLINSFFWALHKKWSFSSQISSVTCGFGQIYLRNLWWKTFFFWAVEVALYVYKSILWPCMDSYCYFWASAPSSFLDKLKKRVCRTVGPSLNALLERLAHHWIISRQSSSII